MPLWTSGTKKYRLKDKSEQPVDKDINATYMRVAKALSDVESKDKRKEWQEKFVWALKHGAIPAGRIISNAGAQAYKPATSTINCTVSGVVPDSMQGILERNLEAGLTLKAGCGIGYEFSTLRPKGAYVSGAGAYTSGPCRLWISMTRCVLPYLQPVVAAAPKWPPLMSATLMYLILFAPSAKTVACVSLTCRC